MDRFRLAMSVAIALTHGLALADTHDSNNMSLSGRWANGPSYAIAGAGNLVYAGDGAIVRVLDVSNPAAPTELGSVTVDGYVRGLALSGNLLCVASHYDGLRVIDVSNPASPVEVGSAPTADTALSVAAVGNIAYVAVSSAGVAVFDLSNPASPQQVGSAGVGYVYVVGAIGTLAFAGAYSDDLYIIDMSNPAAPNSLADISVHGIPTGIVASGDHVFVSATGSQIAHMTAVDISNPALPSEADRYSVLFTTSAGIGMQGDHVLFGAGLEGFFVLDASDPANLAYVGEYDTPGWTSSSVSLGATAFVADRHRGVRAVDLTTPAMPVEIGSFETAGKASHVVVDGSTAYLVDRDDGLHVLDLSNPQQPQEIGSLDTAGIPLHVTLQGSTLYISDDTNGLVIVDVSNPSMPVELATYSVGTGAAWECVIDGNLAYVAGWTTGLHIVDISNPAAPVGLGTISPTTTVLGVDVRYPHAYLACAFPGLYIVDVSDPAQPAVVSIEDTPRAWDVELDDSGDYAIVMDGTSGVTVVDVSDPNFPNLLSTTPAGDYARDIDVEGNFAYVTTEDTGLRVYDLSSLPAISEVAYYDTADEAMGVFADGMNVFVTDDDAGLWQFNNLLAMVAVDDVAAARPTQLREIFPNPFNPRTTIRFELAQAGRVELGIYDSRGRFVTRLLDEMRGAGQHDIQWNGLDAAGRAVSSGSYHVRVEAGGHVDTQKAILVR